MLRRLINFNFIIIITVIILFSKLLQVVQLELILNALCKCY